MLRLLGFATLIMVAICLVLGASIALAVDRAVPARDRVAEVADRDHRMIDSSSTAEKVHGLGFAVPSRYEPHPKLNEQASRQSDDTVASK